MVVLATGLDGDRGPCGSDLLSLHGFTDLCCGLERALSAMARRLRRRSSLLHERIGCSCMALVYFVFAGVWGCACDCVCVAGFSRLHLPDETDELGSRAGACFQAIYRDGCSFCSYVPSSSSAGAATAGDQRSDARRFLSYRPRVSGQCAADDESCAYAAVHRTGSAWALAATAHREGGSNEVDSSAGNGSLAMFEFGGAVRYTTFRTNAWQ